MRIGCIWEWKRVLFQRNRGHGILCIKDEKIQEPLASLKCRACANSAPYAWVVHDPNVEGFGRQHLCLVALRSLQCCCSTCCVGSCSLELRRYGADWRLCVYGVSLKPTPLFLSKQGGQLTKYLRNKVTVKNRKFY